MLFMLVHATTVLQCLMMAGPYALMQTHELIAQVEARLMEMQDVAETTQVMDDSLQSRTALFQLLGYPNNGSISRFS